MNTLSVILGLSCSLHMILQMQLTTTWNFNKPQVEQIYIYELSLLEVCHMYPHPRLENAAKASSDLLANLWDGKRTEDNDHAKVQKLDSYPSWLGQVNSKGHLVETSLNLMSSNWMNQDLFCKCREIPLLQEGKLLLQCIHDFTKKKKYIHELSERKKKPRKSRNVDPNKD